MKLLIAYFFLFFLSSFRFILLNLVHCVYLIPTTVIWINVLSHIYIIVIICRKHKEEIIIRSQILKNDN